MKSLKAKKKVVADKKVSNKTTVEEAIDIAIEEGVITREEIANAPIVIETGKVNKGKKEYKNLDTGTTYFA